MGRGPNDETNQNDERVETLMGRLLQIGVLAAAFTVAVGAAVYLARHGLDRPHYEIFTGEPPALRSLSGIARGASSWRGQAIIQLGLLLLIATPVARVVFSVFAFARERDRVYVALTLVVLVILLSSLLS